MTTLDEIGAMLVRDILTAMENGFIRCGCLVDANDLIEALERRMADLEQTVYKALERLERRQVIRCRANAMDGESCSSTKTRTGLPRTY